MTSGRSGKAGPGARSVPLLVPVALRGSAALLLAACSSKAAPRYDDGLNDGGFQGFDDDSRAEPEAEPASEPEPGPTEPEAPSTPQSEADAGATDAGAGVDAGADAG